jgi:hypothetical protein
MNFLVSAINIITNRQYYMILCAAYSTWPLVLLWSRRHELECELRRPGRRDRHGDLSLRHTCTASVAAPACCTTTFVAVSARAGAWRSICELHEVQHFGMTRCTTWHDKFWTVSARHEREGCAVLRISTRCMARNDTYFGLCLGRRWHGNSSIANP